MSVKWKIATTENFVFVEFELEGGVITPSQLKETVESFPLSPSQISGKGVVLSGRGPVWLYAALVHHLHPVSWVATYDPRLGGGVVVASHIKDRKVGDIVPVDYNSLIFSDSSQLYHSPGKRVAVLGDPNSGKSVFLRLLYDILASLSVPVLAQEADLTAPTQGWSLSPAGAEIRKALKNSLSPAARLDWILKSLAGLKSFPGIVLVDVGGGRPDLGIRVTDENMRILSLCTHAIICSRDDAGQIDAWLREIQQKCPHLRIVAVLQSVLSGESRFQNGRGVITSLDRTLYATNNIPLDTLIVIKQVANMLLINS